MVIWGKFLSVICAELCSFVELIILKHKLQAKCNNQTISFDLKTSSSEGLTGVLFESSYASLVGNLGDLNKGRLFLCFWLCFIDIQEGCLL